MFIEFRIHIRICRGNGVCNFTTPEHHKNQYPAVDDLACVGGGGVADHHEMHHISSQNQGKKRWLPVIYENVICFDSPQIYFFLQV